MLKMSWYFFVEALFTSCGSQLEPAVLAVLPSFELAGGEGITAGAGLRRRVVMASGLTGVGVHFPGRGAILAGLQNWALATRVTTEDPLQPIVRRRPSGGRRWAGRGGTRQTQKSPPRGEG